MSRITFQKRQKEMKRQEKQRAKAERRAQKKLAKRSGVGEDGTVDVDVIADDLTAETDSIEVPSEGNGSEPIG
jgi:7-cyano-7-deazaguanine synthase in queuosine biosynthesis